MRRVGEDLDRLIAKPQIAYQASVFRCHLNEATKVARA
jgi:hypothetical protein